MSTTPSDEGLVEVYAGAKADIDEMAAKVGGWVCEQHPDTPWPHDACPGPGMLKLAASRPGRPTAVDDDDRASRHRLARDVWPARRA